MNTSKEIYQQAGKSHCEGECMGFEWGWDRLESR